MEQYQMPVPPRYGHLWLEELQVQNIERGPKPKAFDTPFRYSDAGKCSRALAYSALGYESEPMDLAGTLVTTLGTDLHEKIQEAISNYYTAEFEVPSQIGGLISGSADGVIDDGEFKVLLEIKTMNGTAYKKSVGVSNKGVSSPSGPRASAIIQSALNAVANDCYVIRIVHVGTEAISKGLAERSGIDEIGRVIAEFEIPQEVFTVIADNEIMRLTNIMDTINDGDLPERIAIDDDLSPISLDPENPRYWQCQYCSYNETCKTDGPGMVTIRKKETQDA